MSVGNNQYTHLQALKSDKKTVASTYTIRTGRVTDGFAIDNPVDIADPAASFTLTLPDGYTMGQEVFVVMSSNSESKTCTLSIAHHETEDSEELTFDAADEYAFLRWTGTEWITVSMTATA